MTPAKRTPAPKQRAASGTYSRDANALLNVYDATGNTVGHVTQTDFGEALNAERVAAVRIGRRP